MKVAVSRNCKKFDIFIGDVILFDGTPCMIIDLGEDSDYFGVLALEGSKAGRVIESFKSLYDFDFDDRVTMELIKYDKVVITKEE